MTNNPQNLLIEAQKAAEDVFLFDDVLTAKKSRDLILKFVQENYGGDAAALAGFKKLADRLGWLALPILEFNEAYQLFGSSFAAALDEDYDLSEKFRRCVINEIRHTERDKIKDNIRKILEKNEEKLTRQNFSNGSTPITGNWIKRYVVETGIKPADPLKIQQFFLKDAEYLKLENQEQRKIRKLLSFYEKLKYKSFDLRGVEETVNVDLGDAKGFVRNGVFVKYDGLDSQMEEIYEAMAKIVEGDKIDSANPDLARLQSLTSQYPAGSLERRAVEEEMRRLGG